MLSLILLSLMDIDDHDEYPDDPGEYREQYEAGTDQDDYERMCSFCHSSSTDTVTKQVGAFMGTTTKKYDGPDVYAGDDVNPCGWMTEGRIWIPLSLCTLEKKVDYRWYRINYNNIARYDINTAKLTNPEQTMIKTGEATADDEKDNELLIENRKIDMSVVTLGGLSHFTYNGNWAYYQAMSIAKNGSLNNMVINVTATIDMKDPKFSLGSEALYVSVF